MKQTREIVWAAVISFAIAARVAAWPATQATAQETHQKIVKLERAALGSDREAATVAIADLQSMGDPAAKVLHDVVRQRLISDRSVIDRAAGVLGDATKLIDFQNGVDSTRKAALDNIAKLDHNETIKFAHQYYDRLMKMTVQLNAANELRGPVLDSIAHRAHLLKIWRESAPDTDPNFTEADEAKLAATAEKILGMKVKDAAEIRAFGLGEAPIDAAAGTLWLYRACRQIEAYNKSLESVMDAEEVKDARMVNAYREALGLIPFEIDARLVQSARRHSREMVDLKYFSHESPTSSEKLFTQRIRNAGYDVPMAENIAAGVADGTGVFWLWFDSPGHHKNMALAKGKALGVGKWGNDFTQNMGAGKRLMLGSEDERKKAVVKGEVLKPETPPTASRRK